MDSHAADLLTLALWFIGFLLTAGGALIWWLVKVGGEQLLERFDVVVERLDTQDRTMLQIRDLLASETSKLRELIHDLDKRLMRVETNCYRQHQDR